MSYLYKNVQGAQRNDDYQKDWCNKTNRKHHTNDIQKGSKELGETSRHHVINATNILGKSVHYPPLGGGLKE